MWKNRIDSPDFYAQKPQGHQAIQEGGGGKKDVKFDKEENDIISVYRRRSCFEEEFSRCGDLAQRWPIQWENSTKEVDE
jgi:hypothetical protein